MIFLGSTFILYRMSGELLLSYENVSRTEAPQETTKATRALPPDLWKKTSEKAEKI